MKINDIFAAQVKKGNFSHAYLILGNFEVEEIIKVFNVKKADLYVVSEDPIKINHIRQLEHWISLKPHSSPLKLVVIWGIERLGADAGHAILKTLEEPPADSIIILQAEKKERILPTILSRCQIIQSKVRGATIDETPRDYQSPEEIARKTIKDRFEYVGKIYERQDLKTILNHWEKHFRGKLQKGEDVLGVLKSIAKARSLLLTNISVKLLLENLLLEF